jgi:hypothetical protein
MVATMFRTWNDKLYLKIDAYQDPVAAVMQLHPGVYFHIDKSARLTDFKFVALKPGSHDIYSIIRMCRCKQLLGQDEKTWRMRRKLLTAISDLHKWLDLGVYEITVAQLDVLSKSVSPSLTLEARRPDYACGPISATEQQRLNRHLNNWMRRATRTEPLAPAPLIGAINNLYRTLGLKTPRIVLVSSPLAVAIAGSFATAICFAKKNPAATADDSREAFDAVASDEIYEASVQSAFRHMEDSIDQHTQRALENLINEVRGVASSRSASGASGASIDNALADAAEATVVTVTRGQPEEFERSIDAAVFYATRSATGTDAEDFLASPASIYRGVGTMFEQLAADLSGGQENVRELMMSCLSDCKKLLKISNMQRYDECLTSALKEVFGLVLTADDKYSAWQNVVTKCGAILFHEQFCIVSEFPEVLNVDEEGRPHCGNGPSSIWKDGWTLYHLHGTRVTRQIIEQMDTITVEDIKREANLEVRRLMLDRYGIKNFLIDSDAKEIHRDNCGVLYSQLVHPALEPIVMVKVVNSTAEPDGTFKDYFLRVPPYIRTATAAVAWTFGVTDDEYQPLMQT